MVLSTSERFWPKLAEDLMTMLNDNAVLSGKVAVMESITYSFDLFEVGESVCVPM